jgi:hypothetical protein
MSAHSQTLAPMARSFPSLHLFIASRGYASSTVCPDPSPSLDQLLLAWLLLLHPALCSKMVRGRRTTQEMVVGNETKMW